MVATTEASGPTSLPRVAGALALAYGLLFFGSPGLLFRDGSFVLAVLGLAFWSAAVQAPGARTRARRLCEWLGGSLYGGALMGWAALVWWPTVLWIGAGFGLYLMLAGWIARRLDARLPAALASAIAWVGVESLRTALPTPLGVSWIRVGHHGLDLGWLAGSVRVSGVAGLSFAAAALGGGLAGWMRRRSARGSLRAAAGAGFGAPVELAASLTPLLLLATGAALTAPPAQRAGPRVMLVQPAFEQERKRSGDPLQNHLALAELTRAGLAAAEAAGEPVPDVVFWGESMLGIDLREQALQDALATGWRPREDPRNVADPRWSLLEDDWVRALLFGATAPGTRRRVPGVLPPGTAFVAGAIVHDIVPDLVTAEALGQEPELVRSNSVVLWNAAGERGASHAKQFLVPGAETMLGLERLEWVARINIALGNYVPDMHAGTRTGIFEFETRAGERFRGGATVCFDNAYLAPYVSPLRAGRDLDFHAVLSNEAWYRRTWEADQMIAFSRAIALATGRSVVRATNSGISAIVGPDGAVIARLSVGGEDRMVRGVLRADVPVPEVRTGAARPSFARWSRVWVGFWLLLPLLACALPARRPVRAA